MQFPITIGLHRSHILDSGLLLAALAASGITMAWPQSMLLRLAILATIAILSLLTWRRLAPALSAIRLERSGQILVSVAGSQGFSAAELLPGATAHPWLTVVRLKTADGRKYLLIATVGALKIEDFRHLRVFLRWRAKFSGQADDA